jgi:hypothetical protein
MNSLMLLDKCLISTKDWICTRLLRRTVVTDVEIKSAESGTGLRGSGVDEDVKSGELTKETNLREVWLQCRRLPESKVNNICTWIVFGVLTLYCALTHEEYLSIAQKVRDIADLGINFAASILGFLLAGFTIFATLSKPMLFVRMAKRRHRLTGFSLLKYNFLAFFKVFAIYIGFVFLCLLVKILANTGGPVTVFVDALPYHSTQSKVYLSKIGYVFLGTWFFYLLVILQLFIFNVYHVVMTGIRWEVNEYDKSLKEDSKRESNGSREDGKEIDGK